MRNLDLWLEYVATGEKVPLNQQSAKEYAVPKAKDVLLDDSPAYLFQILRHGDVSALSHLRTVDDYILAFNILLETNEIGILLKCFDRILRDLPSVQIDSTLLLGAMTDLLAKAPPLAISFGRCEHFGDYPEGLHSLVNNSSYKITRAFILAANEAEELMLAPLNSVLAKISNEMITKKEFAGLVELVSLAVRSPDIALDILLGLLEPESGRLVAGDPDAVRYLVNHSIAIALDHVAEAAEPVRKPRKLLELKLRGETDGYPIVEIPFWIDAPGGTPEKSSHVRLTASTLPTNIIVGRRCSIDALVTHSEQGLAKLMCFHPLPSFYDKCSWDLEDCGPFVTTKAMFDAILTLTTQREECCQVAGPILGLPIVDPGILLEHRWRPASNLNASQNAAVEAALCAPLTCLWGPPGTGKTETIVEMISALQESYRDARVLVTAPSHAAVDNAMRRYVKRLAKGPLVRDKQPVPLRVSTDVSLLQSPFSQSSPNQMRHC